MRCLLALFPTPTSYTGLWGSTLGLRAANALQARSTSARRHARRRYTVSVGGPVKRKLFFTHTMTSRDNVLDNGFIHTEVK